MTYLKQLTTNPQQTNRAIWLIGIVLFTLAGTRLGYESWRLLLDDSRFGAVDFYAYYNETRFWFADPSESIVDETVTPLPATFILLWPLLGWLSAENALILWTVAMIAALGGLIYLTLRDLALDDWRHKLLVVLYLLAIFPTGVTIGNGQLTFFALLVLTVVLRYLNRHRPSWRRAITATPLLLLALMKPHISVPFFWLILWHQRAWRAVGLTFVSYLGLTALALSFQPPGWFDRWLFDTTQASADYGYGNIPLFLGGFGLGEYSFLFTLIIFLLAGGWVYLHRDSDFLLLFGICTLVARIWTYHGLYDDWMIVWVMVILGRLQARPKMAAWRTHIRVLIGALAIGLLVPATLFRWQNWVGEVGRTTQLALWVGTLAWLMWLTWRERVEAKRLLSHAR